MKIQKMKKKIQKNENTSLLTGKMCNSKKIHAHMSVGEKKRDD